MQIMYARKIQNKSTLFYDISSHPHKLNQRQLNEKNTSRKIEHYNNSSHIKFMFKCKYKKYYL